MVGLSYCFMDAVVPMPRERLPCITAGACEDKKRNATLAKKLNLDAIHDTVHEMCKDEARHGCAFNGLLKRYFGK